MSQLGPAHVEPEHRAAVQWVLAHHVRARVELDLLPRSQPGVYPGHQVPLEPRWWAGCQREVSDPRVAARDLAVGSVVVEPPRGFVLAECRAVRGARDVSRHVVVDVVHAGDHRQGWNPREAGAAVRDGRGVRARWHVARQTEQTLGARDVHEHLERHRAAGRVTGRGGGGAARHERAGGSGGRECRDVRLSLRGEDALPLGGRAVAAGARRRVEQLQDLRVAREQRVSVHAARHPFDARWICASVGICTSEKKKA